MKSKFPDLFVNKDDSIIFVLKKMDSTSRKLLIVMNGSVFHSMVSIGDIQRAIINGIDIKERIEDILRKDIFYARTNEDILEIKERMKIRRNEFMPVINKDGEIENIIFWNDIFDKTHIDKSKKKFNLPVIIMAGGQGTRLRPLTNVLPKPLIPINEKTIIEDIIDRFIECGCNKYYISVNYKADFIRYYLNSVKNDNYDLEYIEEREPLGTAGSLYLLKNKISTTFFVTNCDILIDQDYSEILDYHRDNKNEITVVAAMKQYTMPYGTLKTGKDGILTNIEEKPDIIYKINTGFYILEPNLLSEIKENKFLNITTLLDDLLKEKRRIGVFPVNENSWVDIGNWIEYNKYIKTDDKKSYYI
jgi:dTDP-glucose pyrophosphorylase